MLRVSLVFPPRAPVFKDENSPWGRGVWVSWVFSKRAPAEDKAKDKAKASPPPSSNLNFR